MSLATDTLNLYASRQRALDGLHSSMYAIRQVYYNNFRVDLPDFDQQTEPAVPNLLAQGVDQMAGRIASVMPIAQFASAKPGTRTADRRARTAADVISGWWKAEKMPLKMRTRGRHLVAYGMSPVVIRWDAKQNRPLWDIRSPLTCFPDPDTFAQPHKARDVMFTYRRTLGWLKANGYGDRLINTQAYRDNVDNQVFTLVEHISDEFHHLVVVTGENQYDSAGAHTLEYVEHGLGMLPASVPLRTGLDTLQGQFDNLIGMYKAQSTLTALEIIAVEKGIFPDTYLVSRPNEIGRFIDGPHDGRTGKVNVIAGGDIRTEQPQPGYLTNPTIDRLERAQRQNGGIPAEWGGESPTNVRTGRRGDAVLAAATDVTLAECQEIMADALICEDRIAIAYAKKRDGAATRTLWTGTGSEQRKITYTADSVFTADDHTVIYPAIGSDINALSIGLGQRVGMGIMSKQTAAERDPWVGNPETERDRITQESLESALLSGIQQQAASGQIPPAVLSRIIQIVASDKAELADAVEKATQEYIAEQAAAQQQAQQMTPEMAMAAAGAGAGMTAMTGVPASPIPGASEGQQSLSGLLASLRTPAMGITPDVGVEGRM